MTPADLAKFGEAQRRYATLVLLAIEGMATVTDEYMTHDSQHCKLFNAAKNKHQQQFQAQQGDQRQGADVWALVQR